MKNLYIYSLLVHNAPTHFCREIVVREVGRALGCLETWWLWVRVLSYIYR